MIHNKREGIILKISPFKEYDKVVFLFSPEEGLTRVIGKGVRRPGSQRSYHLDLFNQVHVELEASGKSIPLWYLREIHTQEHFKIIKRHHIRFNCASIIALFIIRMLPEGARFQSELYVITLAALYSLNKNEHLDPQSTVCTYLLKAVKILGYFKEKVRADLLESQLLHQLEILDPQFTLQARRTLSIFSSL